MLLLAFTKCEEENHRRGERARLASMLSSMVGEENQGDVP